MNSVKEIRDKIDDLDNRIHDLLIERSECIEAIASLKKKEGVEVVQPAREARMIRRLIERHRGPLPRSAIVQIWRELVSAVSMLQTGINVAVTCPPDNEHAYLYRDMARDYFGSVLPLIRQDTTMAALTALWDDKVNFAVLPWPDATSEDQSQPWWIHLYNSNLNRSENPKPLRIIGKLPLLVQEGDLKRDYPALIISRFETRASGNDASFVCAATKTGISRAKVIELVRRCGLEPLSLHSHTPHDEPYKSIILMELDDFIDIESDPRLENMSKDFQDDELKLVKVGSYPKLQ